MSQRNDLIYATVVTALATFVLCMIVLLLT